MKENNGYANGMRYSESVPEKEYRRKRNRQSQSPYREYKIAAMFILSTLATAATIYFRCKGGDK